MDCSSLKTQRDINILACISVRLQQKWFNAAYHDKIKKLKIFCKENLNCAWTKKVWIAFQLVKLENHITKNYFKKLQESLSISEFSSENFIKIEQETNLGENFENVLSCVKFCGCELTFGQQQIENWSLLHIYVTTTCIVVCFFFSLVGQNCRNRKERILFSICQTHHRGFVNCWKMNSWLLFTGGRP